jgi:hypothetical protein
MAAAVAAGDDSPLFATSMTGAPLIQYLGFTANGSSRDYSFRVLAVQEEPRDIKVSILNEAFEARRARFQDGPDICSHRLQRELVDSAVAPPESCYQITDAELEEYRLTHSPKPRNFILRHKTDEDV